MNHGPTKDQMHCVDTGDLEDSTLVLRKIIMINLWLDLNTLKCLLISWKFNKIH